MSRNFVEIAKRILKTHFLILGGQLGHDSLTGNADNLGEIQKNFQNQDEYLGRQEFQPLSYGVKIFFRIPERPLQAGAKSLFGFAVIRARVSMENPHAHLPSRTEVRQISRICPC